MQKTIPRWVPPRAESYITGAFNISPIPYAIPQEVVLTCARINNKSLGLFRGVDEAGSTM